MNKTTSLLLMLGAAGMPIPSGILTLTISYLHVCLMTDEIRLNRNRRKL